MQNAERKSQNNDCACFLHLISPRGTPQVPLSSRASRLLCHWSPARSQGRGNFPKAWCQFRKHSWFALWLYLGAYLYQLYPHIKVAREKYRTFEIKVGLAKLAMRTCPSHHLLSPLTSTLGTLVYSILNWKASLSLPKVNVSPPPFWTPTTPSLDDLLTLFLATGLPAHLAWSKSNLTFKTKSTNLYTRLSPSLAVATPAPSPPQLPFSKRPTVSFPHLQSLFLTQ